jgi:hypothetical protein
MKLGNCHQVLQYSTVKECHPKLALGKVKILMSILLYSRHYDKDAGSGCEEGCLRNRLCYTVTSQVGVNTQCDILLQEFDSHITAEKITSTNQ